MSDPDQPNPASARHVVGVMTGTSIDGIDAVHIIAHGSGYDVTARLVRHVSRPLDRLVEPLRALAEGVMMTAWHVAHFARELGEAHVETIEALLEGETATPDFIAVHGQTVMHAPPLSWQLIDAGPIAHRFRCPVVCDVRAADLCAGGQGAPITPLADWVMFRDERESRAVVNLGGFCNVTWVGKARRHGGTKARRGGDGDVEGRDVCACNLVLDRVARAVLGLPFDRDGTAARAGEPVEQVVRDLREELDWQRTSGGSRGKSLGSRDDLGDVVDALTARGEPNDLMASVTTAVAGCIASALNESRIDRVILAGGGARNLTLTERIAQAVKAPVDLSEAHGVPIEAREGMAMAILGAIAADGLPITLANVTGRTKEPAFTGVWHLPVTDDGGECGSSSD